MLNRSRMLCVIAGGLVASVAQAQKLNVANPRLHAYAKPDGGREGYSYSSHPTNAHRLYDFYQRQADYYMAYPEQQPEVIPAYPGLDGGKFGHWGKFHQNNSKDGRWNDTQFDHWQGQSDRNKIPDAIALKLPGKHDLHVMFSAKANLGFYQYWSGDFVELNPYRFATSRGFQAKGTPSLGAELKHVENSYMRGGLAKDTVGWRVNYDQQKYLGMYDTDAGAVFSYEIQGKPVLDHMRQAGEQRYRRVMEFAEEIGAHEINLFPVNEAKEVEAGFWYGQSAQGAWSVAVDPRSASLKMVDGYLRLALKASASPSRLNLLIQTNGKAAELKKHAAMQKELPLAQVIKQRSKRWEESYELGVTPGKLGRSYEIDDFELPHANALKSLMYFTGIVFDKSGTAYLTTLQGDVWKVAGLAEDKPVWSRFARGLNQPFGLAIWDGHIHVLEREQITVLKDSDGDGEANFYEVYNNGFSGLRGSHTHTFGMGRRESDKSVHLVVGFDAFEVPADGGKPTKTVRGLRNCMGFGMLADGTILYGPQEGTHTPTSEIVEMVKGDNRGLGNRDPLTLPLGYVPRGVDNSTGGFLDVNDPRFGPIGKGGVLGLCYGYGTWYQILFDQNGDSRQVATVPLDGDFSSGVVRGAVNPNDGQVYVVGLDGWGDYATVDGCLQRIRYTQKAHDKPVAYASFENGIRVHFDQPLEKSKVEDVSKYFAQMWNYRNTRQYGSPEFSIRQPEMLGHDPLQITSVQLGDDGKSIFVEIPDLQAAMTVHLRMHLQTADGREIKTDLFPTIGKAGEFINFPGAQKRVAGKATDLVIPNDRDAKKPQVKESVFGTVDAHAKKVVVKTEPGLKFDTKSFKVKAGESIALVLENVDGMPHNLVIVKPGKKKDVGEAAFKMLNDPNAEKKSYVPDDRRNVIAFTAVVHPKAKHTTYFIAPKTKGEYPFICTFPGHWQAMQGVMIVE